jgi:hypothetical protein
MISIGAHYRGPELDESPIDRLIRTAATSVKRVRGDGYESHSSPAVNVVFYVPGSLGDFPPLDAPRAGRFSRKQKLLLVEVYVPKEQVASGGSVPFVIDALRKSCAIAAEVFEKKKAGAFDLAKANAIVDRVQEALLKTTV